MKKRKKSKIKKAQKRIALIAIATLALALVAYSRFDKLTSSSKSKNTNSGSTLYFEKDAKVVADAYFEAAKQCDLEKANSYRLVPQKLKSDSISKCKTDCPGGITYEYKGQEGTTISSKEGEEVIDTVVLRYSFVCNGEKLPARLIMSRSSLDNLWTVLNSTYLNLN
jgi:hypothetical protein